MRAQGRLQFRPAIGREPKRAEEPRLETADRMCRRQQVVAQLGWIDAGFVGMGQEHKAVYRDHRARRLQRCLTIRQTRGRANDLRRGRRVQAEVRLPSFRCCCAVRSDEASKRVDEFRSIQNASVTPMRCSVHGDYIQRRPSRLERLDTRRCGVRRSDDRKCGHAHGCQLRIGDNEVTIRSAQRRMGQRIVVSHHVCRSLPHSVFARRRLIGRSSGKYQRTIRNAALEFDRRGLCVAF